MKNLFSIRFVCSLAALILLQTTAQGRSQTITKARDFVNYCGTGSRYKDCDEIIVAADIELTSDITLRKNLKIRSDNNRTYTISVNNARQFAINPGYKLSLTNITFDGKNYRYRNAGLFYLNESSDTTKIARLELCSGAIIQNVTVTTTADADHAVIHAKKGSRVIMWDGAKILNCHNKSAQGNGGAICCDSGNIVMNGGTIAGCSALGSGGAIRATGARNVAEDHIGVAMRGDIFLYGGYITNNTCGAGSGVSTNCFGGGIYLGDTGPMLHVIGPAIVSNNVCLYRDGKNAEVSVPDDVSTFKLEDDYANRLKLSGDTNGFVFTEGWIGVRYPDRRRLGDISDLKELDDALQMKRFGGVWEYVTTSHEESRQFFWNGDNSYRGWINGNALVWTRHKIYQLPLDRTTVNDILRSPAKDVPIFIEFNDGFIMDGGAYGDTHIRVPDGVEVTFDLQGHSITCNIEVASGGKVTFRDSSTNRTGKVFGYRDVANDIVKDSAAYTNAYTLEGGSYHTQPDPAWVSTNCVLIENYCEIHPWMVARLAWEEDHGSRIADATLVQLEHADNEIRDVTYNEQTGKFDIDEITFSTGDWVHEAHKDVTKHVRILAVPAISNTVKNVIEECGAQITFFDTGTDGSGIVDSDNVLHPETSRSPAFFGREDTFVWNAKSHGIVKLIHITYTKKGAVEETNAVEQAYFRFPEASFLATQRITGEKKRLPITVVEQLLSSLGYNRAKGFTEDEVNTRLDEKEANGLRRWENIVTGTKSDELLLSTATEGSNALNLNIELSNLDKDTRRDTGYDVWYELRRSVGGGAWTRVGEVTASPQFTVPLMDENGSKRPSGFYRVTTLIIPDGEMSVTNEIPSTNIVGVLEISNKLTNTLAAVPWVSLAADPETAAPASVADFLHTALLSDDDAVQAANNGHIYKRWYWNKAGKKWEGATTVTPETVEDAGEASDHALERNRAIWVKRNDPAAKPVFLIGQYTSAAVTLTIAAADTEEVCTLVPNPTLESFKVNDYGWGDNPQEGDLIRIPNGQNEPHNLRWNGKEWGRIAPVPGSRVGAWKNDYQVDAGTGFWYTRKTGGSAFEITLPQSSPPAE